MAQNADPDKEGGCEMGSGVVLLHVKGTMSVELCAISRNGKVCLYRDIQAPDIKASKIQKIKKHR